MTIATNIQMPQMKLRIFPSMGMIPKKGYIRISQKQKTRLAASLLDQN